MTTPGVTSNPGPCRGRKDSDSTGHHGLLYRLRLDRNTHCRHAQCPGMHLRVWQWHHRILTDPTHLLMASTVLGQFMLFPLVWQRLLLPLSTTRPLPDTMSLTLSLAGTYQSAGSPHALSPSVVVRVGQQ